LDQRFKKIEFNSVLLAIRKVELGVPQGSVLGPLLIVNDIVTATCLLMTHLWGKLVGLHRKIE
jgi:hypothetical protein